ncbi:hypothetical protein AVEN_162241-1 [Araneus ventricosus]|uniref:Pre-C2HC domain-containing protein n=1 Tax=Araneus ventricosus TaxID=182803 RepID=A0A4Y2SLM0_ARAVE|nr:hypothetical protein AVEN_162241-1 [Araneus ventricosus]
MRTQQIKEALIEKDLDVEKIVQLAEYRTKKPLPLFHAVLPNSDKNKSIFVLTDLLNFNISVGRIRSSRFTATSEARVPKSVTCGETSQVVSWGRRRKFHEVSKNNNSNMDKYEPATDFQDIIYIIQEFEKFHLFPAVFLD